MATPGGGYIRPCAGVGNEENADACGIMRSRFVQEGAGAGHQLPRVHERSTSPSPPLALFRHRGGLRVRGRGGMAALRCASGVGGHPGPRLLRQGRVHRARPGRPRPRQPEQRRRHARRGGRDRRRDAQRRHPHHQQPGPARRPSLGLVPGHQLQRLPPRAEQGLELHRRHEHPHAPSRRGRRQGTHQHRPGQVHRQDRAPRHRHGVGRSPQGERAPARTP
jgi:hypothetical protein